jgi:predicted XRE-type DNA-binding protein
LSQTRKVQSVEELFICSLNGLRVSSPHVPHLEQARKAEHVLSMSARAVLKIIEKGLYIHGNEDSDGDSSTNASANSLLKPAKTGSEQNQSSPKESFLQEAQRKICATGLSQAKIGEMLGVTQQAVHNFLKADSVQTRILEKYVKTLKISLDRNP